MRRFKANDYGQMSVNEDGLYVSYWQAKRQIEDLEQQLEKVKEVLRFYANKENYYVTVIYGRVRKPKIDEGKKARDFLGEG